MTTLKQSRPNRLPDRDRQAALAFINEIQTKSAGQLISVIMFGSRARGEAEPDSDMDLLVVVSEVDPETRRTIHYLAAEVWLEYGIFLSTLVWSQDHRLKVEKLQTSLYQEICRDGIELLAPAASIA